jgi:hypothetical protein
MKQMKVWAIVGLGLSMWSPGALAQAKSSKARAAAPDRDQLGMTCAQILVMSSADWVSQFNEKAKDAAPAQQKTLRAITVYGKCYDARTDRLAASLAKSGAGPLMGARGTFRDFQQALDAFTAKALAASDPPADAVKTANAQLYEKQFRYEFYESYEKTPAAKPVSAASAPAPSASSTSSPPSPTAPPSSPASANSAPGAANPVTLAKNHFGELLDALPEDKEHQLHAAFGDIVGRSQMTEATRLEIYRYAIFLLEPPSAQPFSPPPF